MFIISEFTCSKSNRMDDEVCAELMFMQVTFQTYRRNSRYVRIIVLTPPRYRRSLKKPLKSTAQSVSQCVRPRWKFYGANSFLFGFLSHFVFLLWMTLLTIHFTHLVAIAVRSTVSVLETCALWLTNLRLWWSKMARSVNLPKHPSMPE